jgi:plastocyanin
MKTRDLVVIAACALAPAPALAYGQGGAPTTASVTAMDSGSGAGEQHAWSGGDVTLAAGGTVTFSYPSGNSTHNVVFTDAQPSSCTQTAGPDTGPVPPLPARATAPGWAGTCTFTAPGRYAFACSIHTNMTGVVTVVGAEATPIPTPSPPPGASPTPAPTPTGSLPVLQTTLQGAVSLARTQRGTRVRGTVDVKAAGSRLEVSLWAPRRTIAGHRGSALRIGRTVTTAKAGRNAFSVAIDRQARSALRRHRRLTVTVRFALTPPGGRPLAYSSAVRLKAS